jgi:hypothetical protein
MICLTTVKREHDLLLQMAVVEQARAVFTVGKHRTFQAEKLKWIKIIKLIASHKEGHFWTVTVYICG